MFSIGKEAVSKSQRPSPLEDKLHRVHASLNRCLVQDGFVDIFYDIFLESDDRIRQQFSQIDFEKQKKLLRKALLSALTFAAGGSVARERLQALRANQHQSAGEKSPEIYPVWIDALMQAIAVCDLQYGAELEADWRAVLKPTVDFLANANQPH